tara:strand:- start:15080 stop:15253 length:174 start_codon:yes stop_codon:yes gene_type:complete
MSITVALLAILLMIFSLALIVVNRYIYLKELVLLAAWTLFVGGAAIACTAILFIILG